MGIYVRYKNEILKIGDGEDLYCISFQKYQRALKKGDLSQVTGNEPPEVYARHSSEFRFRFPFPDEDKLDLGDIGDFPTNRCIALKINAGTDQRLKEQLRLMAGKDGLLEITHQKLIYQTSCRKFSLVLIIKNPESGNSFRIEDEDLIPKLNRSIIRNYVIKEKDQEKKKFYRSIIARILQGYRREIPVKLTSYGIKMKRPETPKKRKLLM